MQAPTDAAVCSFFSTCEGRCSSWAHSLELEFHLIFTLYSYDINIRVMSSLLLYFEYKSQKLTREWFNPSVGTSSKATVVFLTPIFAVSVMRWIYAVIMITYGDWMLPFSWHKPCSSEMCLHIYETHSCPNFLLNHFYHWIPESWLLIWRYLLSPPWDSVTWSESTSWVWDDWAYIKTYDWIVQWCIEWCTCMVSLSQSKCHSYHIKWNIL